LLELFTIHFARLSYLIIALATLAEGLTIPCPSLAVLLMAGAATATGKVAFWAAVAVGSVSYTIGALVPYVIGYHIPKLQSLPWVGRLVKVSLQSLQAVNYLFNRHGEKIVALARPFWIGNCVSYFAGLNRMPPWKFLLFTFLGISTWSTVVVYLGHVFSSNLGKAAMLVKHYSGLAFIVLVAAAAGAWLLARHLRVRQGAHAAKE
jgi:membrane protein DedA with SNARE-associated domain